MRRRRCIGNLGDVDWLNYGGKFVFLDGERLQIEIVEEPFRGDQRWEVYTIDAPRLRLSIDGKVDGEGRILARLVDESGNAPFWDPAAVARTCGLPLAALIELLTSDDPMARADGYLAVWAMWGVHLADTPLRLTRRQVMDRYRHLRAAGRRAA